MNSNDTNHLTYLIDCLCGQINDLRQEIQELNKRLNTLEGVEEIPQFKGTNEALDDISIRGEK